jgi:hypothetical protein
VQGTDNLLNLDPMGLALVVLRTVVVYLVLLLLLRLAGKRELGQMTPFDLVVLLVISNAVQNAMVGSDTRCLVGLRRFAPPSYQGPGRPSTLRSSSGKACLLARTAASIR